MKPESLAPWLLFLLVLGCAVIVSLLSGCANQTYSAGLQVIERDVAFKLEVEGRE